MITTDGDSRASCAVRTEYHRAHWTNRVQRPLSVRNFTIGRYSREWTEGITYSSVPNVLTR